jgi:hypothetical protein
MHAVGAQLLCMRCGSPGRMLLQLSTAAEPLLHAEQLTQSAASMLRQRRGGRRGATCSGDHAMPRARRA